MADRKRKRTQETLDKLERVKQGMGIPDKMADEFDGVFLEELVGELENAPDGNIPLEAEFTAFAMATAIIRSRISGAFKVLEEAAEATLAGMDDKEIAELIPYIAIELDSRGYDFTSCRWPGKKPPLKELIQAAKRRQSADKGELYALILQNNGINAITHSSKKRMDTEGLLSGEGVIVTRNNVRITLGNASKTRLDVTTHQALDIFLGKLTEGLPYGEDVTEKEINDHRKINISVKEFMRERGLSDAKTARQQLNDGVLTAFNLFVEYDEERTKGRKKQTTHYKLRIVDAIGTPGEDEGNPIKNGVAQISFSYDAAECLAKSSYYMAYPQELKTVNSKQFPHAYYLGRKLAEHRNMNVANSNANRISVRSLLQACPDIPEYREVMGKGRQVSQLIIDKFETNMDALKDTYGVLAKWEYCNSKGEPLTDEQLEKYNYGTWEQLLISFELKYYPDQTKRIEKKTREREAAEEAKKKRQRKAKAKEPVKE